MYCFVNGLPIYYEQYGEGKTILCIHGYCFDHKMMVGCLEPIFSNLNGYRRVYLDLPGMGNTPSTPKIKNADDMLSILIEFVKKVIPNEKFLLAGESYGGYLSLGLIKNMKSKIDGLLLICPVTIAKRSNRKLPEKCILEQDDILIKSLDPSDSKEFMKIAVIATNEIYKRYEDEVLAGIKVSDKQFTSLFQKEGYAFTFESDLRNVVFDKPSCILAGKQDNDVGYEDVYKILNCFPRATFSVLDYAGHNIQIERESLFNCHIEDWLDRVKVYK